MSTSEQQEILNYLSNTEKIMNNQDKQLEIISNKLDSLKTISLDIKNELRDQEDDVEKLESEVHHAHTGLLRGNKKVDKLLKDTKSCCFLCNIL